MLYDVKHYLNPGFLYFKTNGNIFLRVTCGISINKFEYVPSPAGHDITMANNSYGGQDITVNLRIIRDFPYAPVDNYGSFLIYLFNATPGLTNTVDVANAIGGKKYHLTINTYKAGVLKNTVAAPEPISNQSDIDIE